MTEPIYRRSGTRTYFKMKGSIVIRVVNKSTFSAIDVSENHLIAADGMDNTVAIAAPEFEYALNLAKERINNETI